jgi:TatD DNase family protein
MKKTKTPIPELPTTCYLIDSHCHLDMESYQEDLEKILQHAKSCRIKSIITIGIDEKSSLAAVELAKRHPMLKATVGIHPHDAEQIDEGTYSRIRKIVADNKKHIVAYGEIGLDYAKGYSPKNVQLKRFEEQLILAKSLKLPVIIHDRDAHDDCLAILQANSPFPDGGVMHCFSGNTNLAKKVLELGFYISIPGVVTFKNGKELQKVVSDIPLTSLLLETDGPFLAPVPWRGKRNVPAYLAYTAQKVSELKGISIAEVAEQTSANVQKLFRYTPDQ